MDKPTVYGGDILLTIIAWSLGLVVAGSIIIGVIILLALGVNSFRTWLSEQERWRKRNARNDS